MKPKCLVINGQLSAISPMGPRGHEAEEWAWRLCKAPRAGGPGGSSACLLQASDTHANARSTCGPVPISLVNISH